MATTTTTTTLPEDLIFNEILTRLPVKSLLRFKSVCKSWRRFLTGNHRFVTMHLSKHRNKYVMLKHSCRFPQPVHAITLFSRETNSPETTLPTPLGSAFKFTRVAGSCHGLVCITDQEITCTPELPIILWNPSLRKFRVLPRSIFSSIIATVEPHERIGRIVHGFGYHPIIYDYRLVRILYLYDEFEVLRIRAEMYSLRSDSWKEVEPALISHRVLDATCVAANGVLHWIVNCTASSQNLDFVLCFDLGLEEFRRLELPHINVKRSRLCTLLAELEGRLGLVTCIRDHDSDKKRVQIWGLDSENFDWEKKLSFGPFEGIDVALGCGLNGEIYMEDKKGRLVLYDPNSDELRKIKQVNGDRYTFEVKMYMESLIWSDGNGDQVVEEWSYNKNP